MSIAASTAVRVPLGGRGRSHPAPRLIEPQRARPLRWATLVSPRAVSVICHGLR